MTTTATTTGSLKNSVLLANVYVRQWTARKGDKNEALEVENRNNAQKGEVTVHKALISGDSIKKITSLGNKARLINKKHTLPWSDNGDRLLPAENYFNWLGDMAKIRDEFNFIVEEFLSNYDELKNEAKNNLQGLFKESDYPTTSTLREKFSMSFSIMPIGDIEDIRVSLKDGEVDEIKKQISETYEAQIKGAQMDIIDRIKNAVSHLIDRFTAEPEDDKPVRLFDSVTGNIMELKELAPLLNFTNNPEITNIVNMLTPLCVPIEEVKKSPILKIEMVEKAKAILNQL